MGRRWAATMLVIVAGCGGTGRPDAAATRALALRELEKLGADIRHDEARPGRPVVEIDLTRQLLTDNDLQYISPFGELKVLRLGSTEVTTAALAHLTGLARLEKLDLSRTKAGDDGLHHLAGLKELRALYLNGTPVTDAGLIHLKDLPNLEVLELEHNAVGDAGLAHLAGLARLQELNLTGTKVTDAGLTHLRGLTRLYHLYLSGTAVTLDGTDALKKAVPDVKITR